MVAMPVLRLEEELEEKEETQDRLDYDHNSYPFAQILCGICVCTREQASTQRTLATFGGGEAGVWCGGTLGISLAHVGAARAALSVLRTVANSVCNRSRCRSWRRQALHHSYCCCTIAVSRTAMSKSCT
jgi:hypothetical protein